MSIYCVIFFVNENFVRPFGGTNAKYNCDNMVGLRVGDNVAIDRVERMRDSNKFNTIKTHRKRHSK